MRYGIANDLDGLAFSGAIALDDELGQSASWPAELLTDFGKRLAENTDAVYLDDLIAVTKSRSIGRCVLESGFDIGGYYVAGLITEITDRCADTEISRALIGTKLLEFLCVEVVRMWVERVEHPVDRAFNDTVIIEFLTSDVIRLDD